MPFPFLTYPLSIAYPLIWTDYPDLSLVSGSASCRQQYFRVRPQDIEVAEGGTAVIACEVGNREGRVQWTKDGLTLGK